MYNSESKVLVSLKIPYPLISKKNDKFYRNFHDSAITLLFNTKKLSTIHNVITAKLKEIKFGVLLPRLGIFDSLVNMIGYQDFKKLSLKNQIDTLYHQGTFVMGIRYYGYKVNLYLLGRYYWEVFINHKYGEIEKIVLLDHRHSRMKFYADQIKFSECTPI